ncbi:MAG: alpha/beta hydrolase [Candidatus Doudnabacteria bacterium]|nr:alpha/beta hydrolase [Candidatus Doudnabacteria bacterium]
MPVAVIHGDNDPYVPVRDAKEIDKDLNATLTLIPNRQHLNSSAGFDELPEVVKGLRALFTAELTSS